MKSINRSFLVNCGDHSRRYCQFKFQASFKIYMIAFTASATVEQYLVIISVLVTKLSGDL